jgi:hypothetical protein
MERHRRRKSMVRESDGIRDEAWVVEVKVVAFGVIADDTDEVDPLPKATSWLVLRVTPSKAGDV